jgi:hypothetical protein
VTADDSPETPATADAAPLERSEELLDEARAAAQPALAETADDPGAETPDETDYPVPGDDDFPAQQV